ncbi:TetR/AcrR family transcriptional regulator [Bailinhaonella thermotolerans]|uniref:TetR/AcrR family transcriptional regulator n=1 Tax=Bailinhaonella thermotolerans TaxID=1070861 RepID=A0A3A4AKJ7_9ACTN|nr:TetR/AcrR family transcriptional regulator [Bailinhaonella thermotolerans]RJL30176.1 TetR/AcrR family transcriptional regulator [Bailinhaonella thermotolerans]
MAGVRAERRERTRAELVAAGRRLFAAKGYASVTLAEVVAEAGVTKGALYHLFESKAALFRVVLEQVQREVGETVARTADAEAEPWDRLLAGCRAFLAAANAPGIQRIMLVDGPAVLGWNEWRALDEESSARHLAEALDELIAAGVLDRQPVEPLARLLSGAMNEAALWLAASGDPADLERAQAALTRLLEGLRAR